MKKAVGIVAIGLLFMYLGAVIKAEKVKEVHECSPLKEVSQEKYHECRERIDFLSTLFDVKQIFQSMD